MRLLKYLNESFDLEKSIDLIKKDCKPFLKDWKKLNVNKLMLSGRNVKGDFVKGKVRKVRRKSDTPLEIRKIMDDFFVKKFGVKARSNSVFTSLDYSQVMGYGAKVFYLFPIGQYMAISSPDIYDLFADLNALIFSISKKELHQLDDLTPEESNRFYKEFDEMLKSVKYTNKLDLRQSRETMIVCKNYWLLSYDLISMNELTEELK